jgi:hypothetical protein
MAFLVGLVTPDEETELKRRGWVIEDPPSDLREEATEDPPQDGMRVVMVWVDNDLFTIMDGPDWDKGPPTEEAS